MCREVEVKTIEFWEDEYGFRGSRAQVGTFDMIAIDVNHPNYGYFTEYMAFWRSPHIENWQPIPVDFGSYDIKTPEDLIKRFPKFSPLFEEFEEEEDA